MTFHGKYRGDQHTIDHAHESPKSMLIPLGVLSVGAVFAGAVFYSYFMKNTGDFWHGSLPIHGGEHHALNSNALQYAAAEISATDAHHGGETPGGLFGWLFAKFHGYPLWVLLLVFPFPPRRRRRRWMLGGLSSSVVSLCSTTRPIQQSIHRRRAKVLLHPRFCLLGVQT